MNAEFTGERVIPGQVDADLWNEHFARYAFAQRFAAGKRVLDAGCGTGYGSAELAAVAASVTGIDIAHEAVTFAAAAYPAASYVEASCAELPFAGGSFDLVVMFEVIEHVAEWQSVLGEARRVLAPAGRLVVSTPNKAFYAKTRGHSGPNPYHEHEFEYGEFHSALSGVFPDVAIFLEDHTEGVVFRPVSSPGAADVRLQDTESDPEESSFFVAVCGQSPAPPSPAFVYVPRSSNILGEKLRHIERLESELKLKDGWIGQLQGTHQQLLAAHEVQRAELERSNQWAADTAEELKAAREVIAAYKNETARLERETLQLTAACDAQVASLTAIVEETETKLVACAADRDRQTGELLACVEALHKTEATLDERTRWALALDEQRVGLEAALASVRASRWIRLGRIIGLGPELQGL